MNNIQKFFHVSVIEIPTNKFIRKYSNSISWIKIFKYVQKSLEDLDNNCKTKPEMNEFILNCIENLDEFLKTEHIYLKDPIYKTFSFFMREVIAEKVRSEHFPHRPNRQKSIFVVDNIEAAIDFNKNHRDGLSTIYECMPTNLNLLFKADMDIINHSKVDEVNPIAFKENMFIYWEASEPIKIQEILCPCPVKILRIYDSSSASGK